MKYIHENTLKKNNHYCIYDSGKYILKYNHDNF